MTGPSTAVWVPPAPHAPHPLRQQLDALHTATEATSLILPVTSNRALPHTWPPAPYTLLLDLTARLTQKRTPVSLRGTGLSLLFTYCRLLKPRAVLLDPGARLDLHHLPVLPTCTDWWVLGAQTTSHPHADVWDLRQPLPVAPFKAPTAALLRTEDGLPYCSDRERLAALQRLLHAFPGLLCVLPPDGTPYQMRTARELLLLRQAQSPPAASPAPPRRV